MLALLSACLGLAVSGVRGELPYLVGADTSALATLEKHGAVYKVGFRKADCLSILRANGFNCFRLRLFVAPDGKDIVTNDLEYTLALAKRIKTMKATTAFMLDIHYSDTWADPAKQYKPADWANLPYDELRAKVRSYTTEVLKRFAAEGVKPHLVQLGNEISNGMLWPDGRVEFSQVASDPEASQAAWQRLGGLLVAAHEGLADAFPGEAKPVSVLHIESPNQYDRALWFCREATKAGVAFDVIGTSYYPDWHGSVGELSRCLNGLAAEFKKPVMVVETAYPSFPDQHFDNKSGMAWPMTPAGQKQFLVDVDAAVRAVPNGMGRGVFWWYPEAAVLPGLHVWVGGSCALFDRKGKLLPAGSVLRPSARAK